MMSFVGKYTCLLFFLSLTNGQNDFRIPPFITKGPKESITFRPDDAIILECEGTGAPEVNFRWEKNGRGLDQILPNIERGTNGTIRISPASTLDEGYYQCFVANQYGRALSTTSHIQKAVLESFSGAPTLTNVTAIEGEPFYIRALTRKSFPKPLLGWEIVNNLQDINPSPFNPSKRVQIADNGDLHFAYIKPEDDLKGKIYKSTTYNQALDVKAGGGYIKVIVTRISRGQTQFAPMLGFSSEPQTVGLIGESVSLRCLFYGNPKSAVQWKGPGNSLPVGRYRINSSNTELIINDMKVSDEGDYICSGSNMKGFTSHRLQLRVEAKPRFGNIADGPRNTNVTDGEDVTFKCNAEAIPEAQIVWFQDGKPLDVNFPPKRFAFSPDQKTLTIRSVCRNCDDGDRPTDLTVIQCNASNIHGYAFSSGYLNVLAKTQIIPDAEMKVSVGMDEERRLDFECSAVSDPSTPPTVRWYKLREGKEELIYDYAPTVTLKSKDGHASLTLSIYVSPNGTDEWTHHEGEYHCVANNGYSKATRIARLEVKGFHSPDPTTNFLWKAIVITILAVTVVCAAVAVLVLCYCKFRVPNTTDKDTDSLALTTENSRAPRYERIP